MASTNKVTSSAPAHASCSQFSKPAPANLYITSGTALIAPVIFRLKNSLPNAVNSRGAVSPEMRAKASSTPVTMPGSALRYNTCTVTFHCGTPNDNAASRICTGTSRNISSVVRTTTGNTINANESAPAMAENLPPVFITKAAYTNRPSTIDGADIKISLTKRTAVPSRLCPPTSASQVPAAIPIGVPMATPIPHINKLPTMALRKPPASIGGG